VKTLKHPVRLAAVCVLVVVAVLLVVLATRPQASELEASSPLLGKPAPAITGTTLSGSSFDLSSYKGRWVVVNFFASWCGPCQQEQPDLVEWSYNHRGPDDPALVGVAVDDAPSQAKAFMTQTGGNWPAVADQNDKLAVDYGVSGPPEFFLVTPAGDIAACHIGPITSAELDALLTRLGAS
jgi:thiol-disulfide isomerase/thioredoxin